VVVWQYASHAKPFPNKVETLRDMSGHSHGEGLQAEAQKAPRRTQRLSDYDDLVQVAFSK
jgi:hypothetical protein